MTKPNDPAFLSEPKTFCRHQDPDIDCSVGLTKREYFAAMAMQGLIATLSSELAQRQLAEQQAKLRNNVAGVEGIVAKCAVDYADGLIRELNNR